VSEVVKEFDDELPAVVCYPGDINQVVLNLLVNAAHAIKEKVKDGEKGQITVRTRMMGECVEISVSDTGSGIPEAIRNRVFDPFFTTKEVGKGTGQGLALAYTVVVKKHGGKIWFESEVGKGTTFFITLPVSVAAVAKGGV
jgi:signal transduction histidine kinase